MHTGNIFFQKLGLLKYAVYPCAYREHDQAIITIQLKNGLSLCIQGTLATLYVVFADCRFIPVHTGNMYLF